MVQGGIPPCLRAINSYFNKIVVTSFTSKTELRRILLQRRQSMTQKEGREKSNRICFHLQSSPLFIHAKTICAFFSFRREPDLSPLFVDHKHNWAFPRCVDDSLIWHLWKPGNATLIGAYGIIEPHPDAPIVSISDVDLMLVPAIACDERGYRLGYGGGYYDRLLSSSLGALPTIGITFEFACFRQIPINSWDKRLDYICTETGLKITY